MRRALKKIFGHLLWPFPARGVASCFSGGTWGFVFTFHYLGDPIVRGFGEDIFLAKNEFVRILDFLKKEFNVLEPKDFLERFSSGLLPRRAALLTFDDGPQQILTDVLPELVRRDLKACFFVSPGLVENRRPIPPLELMTLCRHAKPDRYELILNGEIPDWKGEKLRLSISGDASRASACRLLMPYLLRCPSRRQAEFLNFVRTRFQVQKDAACPYLAADWGTVTSLKKAGMSIGNHTLYHSTIAADGASLFSQDVKEAFDLLEGRSLVEERIFCFPYGRREDISNEAFEYLQEQHVRFAFLTGGGIARRQNTPTQYLKREEVNYSLASAKLSPLLALLR